MSALSDGLTEIGSVLTQQETSADLKQKLWVETTPVFHNYRILTLWLIIYELFLQTRDVFFFFQYTGINITTFPPQIAHVWHPLSFISHMLILC